MIQDIKKSSEKRKNELSKASSTNSHSSASSIPPSPTKPATSISIDTKSNIGGTTSKSTTAAGGIISPVVESIKEEDEEALDENGDHIPRSMTIQKMEKVSGMSASFQRIAILLFFCGVLTLIAVVFLVLISIDFDLVSATHYIIINSSFLVLAQLLDVLKLVIIYLSFKSYE